MSALWNYLTGADEADNNTKEIRPKNGTDKPLSDEKFSYTTKELRQWHTKVPVPSEEAKKAHKEHLKSLYNEKESVRSLIEHENETGLVHNNRFPATSEEAHTDPHDHETIKKSLDKQKFQNDLANTRIVGHATESARNWFDACAKSPLLDDDADKDEELSLGVAKISVSDRGAEQKD